MKQNTIDDLNNIFEWHINPDLMERLDAIFELIFSLHPNIIRVKTRNDKDEILSYRNQQYFSLVQISQEKTCCTCWCT